MLRLARRDDGFPAHAGMDRHRGRDLNPGPGFPRPRGDGPGLYRVLSSDVRVSPPTRGWTLCAREGRAAQEGFPAHAGMDPSFSTSTAPSQRFPRPRGDGPRKLSVRLDDVTVSPPTRGWTIPVVHVGEVRGGFPAHAGMDPVVRRPTAPRNGFPRPRGDGPWLTVETKYQSLVSPPTRGWTSSPATARRFGPGFPAHAGMDPCLPNLSRASTRFPRPRGDGPGSSR